MKTLLLGVLLAVYVALADLPTQPAAFAGRGPLPMLAYSFRQSQCSEGAIVQDIGSTVLSLTRDSAATRCPVRTNAKWHLPVRGRGDKWHGDNLGKPYYIAISIDGLTSTSTATLYIAKKGDALVSASTAGGAFTKLALATGSILRVGSTKGNGQPNSNDRLPIAFYGEVNFLAFHTIAFTQPQAAAAYAGGLPNSQPSLLQSPPGISVTVDGIAAGAVIDLGAVLKYYDADGNTLNNYVLTAVPTKGDLLRNNVAITSADLTIGAGLVLKYRPVSGEFSCDVASVEPTCSTVYASFKVFASDGLCSPLSCNSPNNATVNVYVRDVYYKPVVTSTISVVKSNANVVFEITATDSNDVCAPFTSPSRLHDIESNGEPLGVVGNGWVRAPPPRSRPTLPFRGPRNGLGEEVLAFCFVDAAHKTSTFQYYVSDKNGLRVTRKRPRSLNPCRRALGPKPAGADAVCLSHGFETVDAASPSFIPVFLQATNTLGGVLTFKALTFPRTASCTRTAVPWARQHWGMRL
ncbi:hypothetical protein BASA82_000301 [Batrachochytrium salamandrivorans]|nr:hypothetical protein BASA82_000301 [Batrachochytrium salamandrivorans]